MCVYVVCFVGWADMVLPFSLGYWIFRIYFMWFTVIVVLSFWGTFVWYMYIFCIEYSHYEMICMRYVIFIALLKSIIFTKWFLWHLLPTSMSLYTYLLSNFVIFWLKDYCSCLYFIVYWVAVFVTLFGGTDRWWENEVFRIFEIVLLSFFLR